MVPMNNPEKQINNNFLNVLGGAGRNSDIKEKDKN